jgi:hypothetical protein
MGFEFDLVLDPKGARAKEGGESPGTRRIAGTFDAVIDGSARDSVMKGTVKSEITGKSRGGVDFKTTIDGSMDKTVRTAK